MHLLAPLSILDCTRYPRDLTELSVTLDDGSTFTARRLDLADVVEGEPEGVQQPTSDTEATDWLQYGVVTEVVLWCTGSGILIRIVAAQRSARCAAPSPNTTTMWT
jgi:hypothetical protein